MRILLTGGGTGGHIYPNIAIVEEAYKNELKTESRKAIKSLDNRHKSDYKFLYVGEIGGMEEKIVKDFGVKFKGIYCGKLRRYFSFKTFLDFFKIPIGFLQSLLIIIKFKPDIIFSKGGYVSVPIALASQILRKKFIIHDSDSIPGLTTKICAKFANKICLAYKEARKYLPKSKVVVTGIPLRRLIFNGKKDIGYKMCSFNDKKPIILVFGGSLGATFINKLLWDSLPALLKKYQIIHLTGKGKTHELDIESELKKRFKMFEYVDDDIAHLYSIADLIICRAGANAIADIESLGKASILIPLTKQASHGDQIVNAEILKNKDASIILEQDSLNKERFITTIDKLINDKRKKFQLEKNIENKIHTNSAKKILEIIRNEVKK